MRIFFISPLKKTIDIVDIYLFINMIIRKRSSKLGDQCTYVYDIDDTILKTLITGCPASSRNRFGGGFCT